ncbi:hypothetical protein F2Q69_00030001 [Brassica cretica]|uniref:Aspartic peptidase DDI1-type domain-containing protein n=1 Tax=Brassica cretica TaxID=69181 RepID=A0A8S9RY15_BRACR|nr:hypothetical protein F2Q69_00030001 [Brassica cretica]
MVAIVILKQDENGNLYDQDGHLRNATGQKLDAQGNNPPPQTQESKIVAMLDIVLEGQQQLTVNFNGKIDSAYNSLNTRIETLGTHVRKLEMQVVQTGDTVKRQEALAKEAGVEKAKHHVNAIIYDDYWQVVRHEKLGEGDFEVESSMSFDGSQCSNTHEEFAEKHPHPPSPFYVKIDRPHEPAVDRQRETNIDRPPSPPIDRRAPLTYRVRLPSIDNDRINALRPPPKQSANPPELTTNPSYTTPEPMQVDEVTEGRRLRKMKEKIPKNLKREANEKEMDGFTKRVLRIPVEKPFDEVYFTHRLWMFFRETKKTEEDIRRVFHHVRERMKLRITLKKKSDPRKFAIPCVVKGIEFPHALCDTGASVSILPKVMAGQLGLKIEHSSESFTFVDLSEISSGGIIRDLEVQIGAVCDMNTNRLCLILIDPDVHYDPVRVVRQEVNLVELGNDVGYIAACHSGAEYETEFSESIDTLIVSSIDSNESPTTDELYPTSLDGKQPVDHLVLPDQCYPDFAFQQPNNRGRDDYSIGSWADSGFHESFAVDTVIPSSNEDPTEEFDEDY